jgi:uncharacterized membrane protein
MDPSPARIEESDVDRVGDDSVSVEEAVGRRVLAELTEISRTEFSLQRFSSPLLPPDYIEAYEKWIPNAGERLMVLAESQSAHRQSIEAKVIEGDNRRADRGQHYALALGGGILALAAYMVYEGDSKEAAAMVCAVLVAGVSTFLYATHTRSRERQSKRNVVESAPGEPRDKPEEQLPRGKT